MNTPSDRSALEVKEDGHIYIHPDNIRVEDQEQAKRILYEYEGFEMGPGIYPIPGLKWKRINYCTANCCPGEKCLHPEWRAEILPGSVLSPSSIETSKVEGLSETKSAEEIITEKIREINPKWDYGETHEDVFRALWYFFDPPVARKIILSAIDVYAAQFKSPSVVEQKKDTFTVGDMEKAFIAGRDCVDFDGTGHWMRYNFIDWFNKEQGLPPVVKPEVDPNELPY